jgi:ABC-type glycerol-3-phosphate transport system substrate-binding protein
MIKRLLSLLLALFVFCGCGVNSNTSTSQEPGATPTNVPQDTGLIVPSTDMIADIAIGNYMEDSGTLRIGLYRDDDVSKKALAIFNEKFPGWKVEVTKKIELTDVVYDADGNIVSGNLIQDEEFDIVKMLEDNEVDLLEADTTSFTRLWASGLMQDLMLMFQNDTEISLNSMLPQIRELLMYEGKLPLIPIWFSTKFLIPHPDKEFKDQDEIPDSWTWQEAADWHKEDFSVNDVKLLIPGYSMQWVVNLLSENYMYYQGATERDVNFDSPVLKEILFTAKSLYDEGRINDLELDDATFRSQIDNGDFLYQIGTDGAEEIVNYETLESVSFGKLYPYPIIQGTEGKGVSIESAFGINAVSDDSTKTAAWEFIKILLSEEIQNGDLVWNGACPVIAELNKAGLARLYFGSGSDINEDSITDEELENFNNTRQAFYSDVNRISNMRSEPLLRAIMEPASSFIMGDISMSQAIGKMKEQWETQM